MERSTPGIRKMKMFMKFPTMFKGVPQIDQETTMLVTSLLSPLLPDIK